MERRRKERELQFSECHSPSLTNSIIYVFRKCQHLLPSICIFTFGQRIINKITDSKKKKKEKMPTSSFLSLRANPFRQLDLTFFQVLCKGGSQSMGNSVFALLTFHYRQRAQPERKYNINDGREG